MPVTRQRTLDYMEFEWGTYVERFQRLPEPEQKKRLDKTGYDSLRDLLAHVLVWWEEAMGIIRAIVEGREYKRIKYDFDSFNAEAVTRFRDWDEPVFLAHFEKERRKMEAEIRSMEEAVFENRRLKSWLNAVVILHAREHLLTLNRFLAIDLLQNEWADLAGNFERLDEGRKKEFLAGQGFESFRDFLAHILGWWVEGSRLIDGILNRPGFTWREPDTDEFNRMLINKYSSYQEEDLIELYDTERLAMIDLIAGLPDDAFWNADIESWLVEDVVEHYDEHAIPR